MMAVSGKSAAQHGEVTATLAEHRIAAKKDTLVLDIAVRMTAGWHIGAVQPGVVGVPTELNWRLPASWRVLSSHWPTSTASVVGRDTSFEYRGPFTIKTTLVGDGSRTPGRIHVVLSYGICREVCIPGRIKLTYDVR